MESNKRVLILEDDYSELFRLQNMLRKLGHIAVIVTAGNPCKKLLLMESFHAVILDNFCPKFTGEDVKPDIGLGVFDWIKRREIDVDRIAMHTSDPDRVQRVKDKGGVILPKSCFFIEELQEFLVE